MSLTAALPVSYTRRIVLAVLLLALVPSAYGQPVEPGQTFTARVVDVVDGDTHDVPRSAGGEACESLPGGP